MAVWLKMTIVMEKHKLSHFENLYKWSILKLLPRPRQPALYIHPETGWSETTTRLFMDNESDSKAYIITSRFRGVRDIRDCKNLLVEDTKRLHMSVNVLRPKPVNNNPHQISWESGVSYTPPLSSCSLSTFHTYLKTWKEERAQIKLSTFLPMEG